jgi:hypothetical protein
LLVARTSVRLQDGSQRDQPLTPEGDDGARVEVRCEAFNDTVVLGGNVPLDVLAKNVDAYIRTTTR